MHPDQGQWAVILVPIVAEELDTDVPCPNLRVGDEKGLDLSRVSGFVCPDIFPFLHLDRVSVADTDSESPYHTREELIIGENHSIDPNIFLSRLLASDLIPQRSSELTESSIITNLFSTVHSESIYESLFSIKTAL